MVECELFFRMSLFFQIEEISKNLLLWTLVLRIRQLWNTTEYDGCDECLHGHVRCGGTVRAAGAVVEANCAGQCQRTATSTQNAWEVHLQLGGAQSFLNEKYFSRAFFDDHSLQQLFSYCDQLRWSVWSISIILNSTLFWMTKDFWEKISVLEKRSYYCTVNFVIT